MMTKETLTNEEIQNTQRFITINKGYEDIAWTHKTMQKALNTIEAKDAQIALLKSQLFSYQSMSKLDISYLENYLDDLGSRGFEDIAIHKSLEIFKEKDAQIAALKEHISVINGVYFNSHHFHEVDDDCKDCQKLTKAVGNISNTANAFIADKIEEGRRQGIRECIDIARDYYCDGLLAVENEFEALLTKENA